MSFYSSFRQRLSNAIGSLNEKAGMYAGSSFNRYPRLYAGLAAFAAITAYVYVLLFPLLFLTGLIKAYSSITADVVDWLAVSIWLFAGAVAGFVSYRCMQARIAEPVGFVLAPDDAPKLFRLIQQTKENFGRPSIHRVVITGDYELDIRKVPKWMIPVWSSNVMVIGLPSLLCHTPEHFACMVNRRVGQFSKRNNMFTNWLYQLRSVWQLYYTALKIQRIIGTEPLKWFYAVFVPIYGFVSTVAARNDELKADSYAMDIYNDEIVRRMITANTVYRWYLQHQYWPAVDKIPAMAPKTKVVPYAKMTAAVRNKLSKEKIAELLSELSELEPSWKEGMPALKSRLENIGHDSPYMEVPDGDTAAAFYIGKSVETVTNEIDRRWYAARV